MSSPVDREVALAKAFGKRCANCGPKQRAHFLYEITAETGTMEGRIGVGNVIGEHRQYPKEYTWEVFDMKTWNIGGSYSGKFLGRVPVDVK